MTDNEYNDVVQALYLGHEITFCYKGKEYFLERNGELEYLLYDMTDKSNVFILEMIQGNDLTDIVLKFINRCIIENRPFCEFYPHIDIYDIE